MQSITRAPRAAAPGRQLSALCWATPPRHRVTTPPVAMPPSIFDTLAEQRIADAQRRGELDGLPGAGRPLVFDDDPFVSSEQRMVNRVLKNAGFAPPEIALRAELAALPDGERRARLRARLAQVLLQLALGHDRRPRD